MPELLNVSWHRHGKGEMLNTVSWIVFRKEGARRFSGGKSDVMT